MGGLVPAWADSTNICWCFICIMRIEIKIQRQQTLAQHKWSHQVRAHRKDSCTLGFHNPLCHWGRYLTVNSLLVGCSRTQELMAKIFAGLTGRCQHPSLNTNYIISTLKAAMENWRIQIQVPGGMLCLVSAINPSTEAMLLPSSLLRARIYCLANPSQQRLESRQAGICTESIHLQLAGPQHQTWASRKLESSAANPTWVAQPPLTGGDLF